MRNAIGGVRYRDGLLGVHKSASREAALAFWARSLPLSHAQPIRLRRPGQASPVQPSALLVHDTLTRQIELVVARPGNWQGD